MKTLNIGVRASFLAAALTLSLVPAAPAQEDKSSHGKENSAGIAQIVALDECDPAPSTPRLGRLLQERQRSEPFTTLYDLFAKAAAGTPDPGWDFEPDALKIKKEPS